MMFQSGQEKSINKDIVLTLTGRVQNHTNMIHCSCQFVNSSNVADHMLV